ncbi:hypothetical protein [Halobaculum magnesiiphilum]|uniref:Uncharacterized protein n=1 Tax=Halobaculum magnesiiphilum TaxID=1017351 RepID=A0A8T8W9S1_9EURY|nr:hypothetical protein [Halobaculum magnesiiphilum]QZP36587.1 hypothetical protein K6T50_09695 [Halobaculum magnesiiphilum]
MEWRRIRTVFLNRVVFAAFLLIFVMHFVPPMLPGDYVPFDRLADPVWKLALESGRALGCRTLSCLPLVSGIFLIYTYLLSVLLGALYYAASSVIRGARVG